MTADPFDPAPFARYLASIRRDVVGVDAAGVRIFIGRIHEDANDLEYLRKYAEACPVPGVDPAHYAARVLQLGPTCSVLASIHFRRRATDFPFVDISAQSGPLPRPLPLDQIISAFSRFRPRAVRIWRSATDTPCEQADDDLVIVAGSLQDLQEAPDLPHVQRIRLEPDPEVASYGEYRRIFEAVHSSAPETAAVVLPETHMSLADCASAGTFFRVLVDDTFAGIIAARPGTYRYWRGWNMVEEVLHPAFHGRKLGPAMQQAFLRRLDADREPCVFGTISARNAPSLKTALRVGRHVVEVGTFVNVPESD